MKTNRLILTQAVIRFIITSGLIIAAGYAVYHESVFMPTMWPFQFLGTGITLGIAYASFKLKKYRIAAGLLFFWYIVFTGILFKHDYWIFILNGTYIALTSSALYLFLIIIQKSFASSSIFRVILSGLLFGITNGLVILLLALFSSHFDFNNLSLLVHPILLNLRIGIIIGILTSIGIDLSETLIKAFLQ